MVWSALIRIGLQTPNRSMLARTRAFLVASRRRTRREAGFRRSIGIITNSRRGARSLHLLAGAWAPISVSPRCAPGDACATWRRPSPPRLWARQAPTLLIPKTRDGHQSSGRTEKASMLNCWLAQTAPCPLGPSAYTDARKHFASLLNAKIGHQDVHRPGGDQKGGIKLSPLRKNSLTYATKVGESSFFLGLMCCNT